MSGVSLLIFLPIYIKYKNNYSEPGGKILKKNMNVVCFLSYANIPYSTPLQGTSP
jgi:hypothetical protein